MEAGTRLVVGLGNPGAQYSRTRHNIGFIVVEELALHLGDTTWRTKGQAREAAAPLQRAVLIEPLSYMNSSGGPLRAAAAYYRAEPRDVLVVSDDLDLPFGKLRLRTQGGHGGHNGLRSIIEAIGPGFPRLRIGIGRPAYDALDHVLQRFDDIESKELPTIVAAAVEGIETWLTSGVEAAMQLVNRPMQSGVEPG